MAFQTVESLVDSSTQNDFQTDELADWVQCRQWSIECSGYIVPWTYNDKYLSFVIKSIFQRPEERQNWISRSLYQANLCRLRRLRRLAIFAIFSLTKNLIFGSHLVWWRSDEVAYGRKKDSRATWIDSTGLLIRTKFTADNDSTDPKIDGRCWCSHLATNDSRFLLGEFGSTPRLAIQGHFAAFVSVIYTTICIITQSNIFSLSAFFRYMLINSKSPSKCLPRKLDFLASLRNTFPRHEVVMKW